VSLVTLTPALLSHHYSFYNIYNCSSVVLKNEVHSGTIHKVLLPEIMLSGDAISKIREAGQKKQEHTNTEVASCL
jgi:hypothetical protein